jgi:hypothetical protein
MFAAVGSSGANAIRAAEDVRGTAFVAVDGQRDPYFTTLVLGGDADRLTAVADRGLYEVDVRRMRHQRRFWPPQDATPGVTVAFVMLRRSDLTHEEADSHWRDVHAPLALRHHPGMWHYHQVSIEAVVAGPPIDGIALCAFASEQEFAERLFGTREDRDVILEDVARFADVERSPRGIRMTEWRFGSD